MSVALPFPRSMVRERFRVLRPDKRADRAGGNLWDDAPEVGELRGRLLEQLPAKELFQGRLSHRRRASIVVVRGEEIKSSDFIRDEDGTVWAILGLGGKGRMLELAVQEAR